MNFNVDVDLGYKLHYCPLPPPELRGLVHYFPYTLVGL